MAMVKVVIGGCPLSRGPSDGASDGDHLSSPDTSPLVFALPRTDTKGKIKDDIRAVLEADADEIIGRLMVRLPSAVEVFVSSAGQFFRSPSLLLSFFSHLISPFHPRWQADDDLADGAGPRGGDGSAKSD